MFHLPITLDHSPECHLSPANQRAFLEQLAITDIVSQTPIPHPFKVRL
jgi:hypothetical protein